MGAVCCHQDRVDYDGEVDLFHFHLLRNVGKGAFGKVRTVQHKQTKDLFALKYIDKSKCVKMKAVANTIQERRLLEEIHHPFVVNLRYAFQDDENCFLVLDLMLGGDLRFHLDRIGKLPEDAVRLYVAQIASAVTFLHTKRIIHRDIKPDNILLDSGGHAHLTDFNVAVYHPQDKLLTRVAGSKAYMAPEMYKRKGYSYAVDWWSLGVTAYELAFGKRPFRAKRPADLARSICRGTIQFSDEDQRGFSLSGIAAIQAFLELDPVLRLGCETQDGLDGIKRHMWFRPIDWHQLQNKEIISPFIPDADKPNFDLTYELEELLLEERPLRVRRRKANQDLTKMSPGRRKLEEEFTTYDFRRMARRSYYPYNQQISALTSGTSDIEVDCSRPSTPGLLDGEVPLPKDMLSEEDVQFSEREPQPGTNIVPYEKVQCDDIMMTQVGHEV